MAKQIVHVFHQDSPGMKTWVVRGWWERLFYHKDFAMVGEKTYVHFLDAWDEAYDS